MNVSFKECNDEDGSIQLAVENFLGTIATDHSKAKLQKAFG